MTKVDTSKEFYSDRDASDYLGITVDQLRGLRFRGGGPAFFKLGVTVRYNRNDLQNYLEKSRKSTAEQK